MSGQILTQSDLLQDACALLGNAEAEISFICKQVARNKITPEMALLKIHVDTLPTIVSAHNIVSRVKDELRAAEALNEGETDK